MTMEQLFGLLLALGLMAVGVLGSVLPVIPGSSLILATAVVHRLYFGPAGASWWVLGTMAGFVALSLGLDYLATMYGARRLGAGRLGMVGALLGGLVGIFFSLPGILLGPFVGAFLFELASRRPCKTAALAGLGAMFGLAAGALGKFVCCVIMVGLFTVSVILRSGRLPAA